MKNKLFLSLLLTSIQMSGQVTAASCPLRFTEVCVANIDQTIDHSNNYGSWVELHNPTDDTVSIEGWYVSDDAGDLKKHRLQGAERIGPREAMAACSLAIMPMMAYTERMPANR